MMYTYYVHRTQILLEERQYTALKAWGRRRNKSLSELIRMAVDKLLQPEKPLKRGGSLDSIQGIALDPGGPSSADHDRILYGGD